MDFGFAVVKSARALSDSAHRQLAARARPVNSENPVPRSNPLVRRATPADAPAIVEFQRLVALETEGKDLDFPTVTTGVDVVMSSHDRGFYIVAELDDSVVGSLLITYEWSDWRNATFWWIQSVFVDAEYRRRGVYTAMHNHVLNRAEQDPAICGVRLYVERANIGAQATYKHLGMDHSHYDLYEVDFVL